LQRSILSKPDCTQTARQCNRESIIKIHSLFNLLILLDRAAQNILDSHSALL